MLFYNCYAGKRSRGQEKMSQWRCRHTGRERAVEEFKETNRCRNGQFACRETGEEVEKTASHTWVSDRNSWRCGHLHA